MVFKELAGSRIRLINLNEDYLNDIHEYSILPQFYEHLEYPPFTCIEDTKEFLAKLMKRSDDVTGHYWFIYHIDSKKVIGTIAVLDIDKRKGSAELAYGLSPLYWGNGFFSESLKLVIDWFFELLGNHRLFIKTAVNNVNSINAVTKMGFKKEGLFRDYYLDDITKKRSDAMLLSMLKSDKPD